jgi:hypothetical protein
LEEHEAELAQLYAQRMRDRALVAELWTDEQRGFAEMELAGTALVGQVRAARELEDARRLTEVLPRLLELLEAGAVFVPAAELLLRETRRCTGEVQRAVDARISAELVGLNTTEARRLVVRTVLEVEAQLDPALTQERLEDAKKAARVWTGQEADGMLSIGAVLDAVEGRRWVVDFEQLVHAQQLADKRAGVERTSDAVRAAVFATLPTLVLELCRAARDGRLTELAAVAELDPEAAEALQQLAVATADLPLPVPETASDEIRVEADPFDDVELPEDPHAGLPPVQSSDPGEPAPEGPLPPEAAAAQDAAQGRAAGRTERLTDQQVDELVLRCLLLPLAKATVVNVHLPMATALGLSSAPGDLEGYGPLPGSRLRALMPGAALRAVYVDERTGVPLGISPTQDAGSTERLLRLLRAAVLEDRAEAQHDPSKALVDLVRLRDVRCGGPGCSTSAARCHLDHEKEWPEGPTAAWNLNPKSPRCHRAKHHGWTVERHADGSQTWTSPTGRVYGKRSPWSPPPRVENPWNVELSLPAQPTFISPSSFHPS